MTTPDTLDQKYATEYLIWIKWPDEEKSRPIFITRHSNHREWIDEGGWVACIMLSSMSPWYLSDDGIWRYKAGHRFESAEQAYQMVRRAKSIKESYELQS